MAKRLITKAEAGELCGLHPETIIRAAKAGTFPAPVIVHDGPKPRLRFDVTDIEAWIERRKEAARARYAVERDAEPATDSVSRRTF
jgi:predicted DNA-binding transcriptional regulator AlpA